MTLDDLRRITKDVHTQLIEDYYTKVRGTLSKYDDFCPEMLKYINSLENKEIQEVEINFDKQFDIAFEVEK